MTPVGTPQQHTASEADDVNVKSNYVVCWERTKPQPRPLLPTPHVPPLV